MTSAEALNVPAVHPDSVLFISLDSCRYDTFLAANLPNMKAIGPLHRAQAPSHFTYGSHAAMFVGFTPGVADRAEPFLNPKFARLFRLNHAGHPGIGASGYLVYGDNIPDGFRKAGFRTIGTASMAWFNPDTDVSAPLRQGFDEFWFARREGVEPQVAWVEDRLNAARDPGGDGAERVFAFMNIGETHVPYYFNGAPWDWSDSPCVAFQTVDRSGECRERQTACVEHVDRQIAGLLDRFRHATILICSDHGDCWGEDGLWEHGVSHEMTLTVPLIVRFKGEPVG